MAKRECEGHRLSDSSIRLIGTFSELTHGYTSGGRAVRAVGAQTAVARDLNLACLEQTRPGPAPANRWDVGIAVGMDPTARIGPLAAGGSRPDQTGRAEAEIPLLLAHDQMIK